MRKIISWGGWGILSLLLVQSAWAAQLEWLDKSTIVVDDVFQFNKPDPKWDTQKVSGDPDSPVKWILHKAGRNPLIKLTTQRHGTGLMGKGAYQYAAHVKEQYRAKGVTIQSIEKRLINGRPVALLHGMKPDKNEKFLIGVWRSADQGFILECSAHEKDFVGLMPQFHEAINTARILKKR